ncbi:MAG: Zn(2+)-responsive transcriptional regulator [Deltaproteobacteria bacterium]|nr:Zn(2+)-responsive transcriptional regulator [Deltaproteobacteria bacterium]MBW2072157.1 Zn(2+)-responsive transcriptional regulator [Deltaproteobacteria bacterium]
MKQFTIGQLARKAKVNIQTIRYYERRGLMPEPVRRESGYRQYSQKDLERLNFIRHAKELGFSLKEISELFSLRMDPRSTCADVKKRTQAKIVEVETKIRALQEIKRALTQLANQCWGSGPTSECPILEALNSKDL